MSELQPATEDLTEQADGEIEDSRMTLSEHLNELRSRLVRSLIVFVVAFSVLYTFREVVTTFIVQPQVKAWEQLEEKLYTVLVDRIEDGELVAEDIFVDGQYEVSGGGDITAELLHPERYLTGMVSIQAGGNFFFKIKVCFLAALAVSIPVALWELWAFIAAGLYKREKRLAYWFLPPAIALFYAGLAFGYLLMVPAAVYFTQADGLGVEDPPFPRLISFDNYLPFLRGLCLALGIIFQIPIIQLMLAKTGIVHPSVYAKYRGHMALALLVFAALITPPDPITQVLLAGPAIALWEIGYWVSRFVTRNQPEPIPEPA